MSEGKARLKAELRNARDLLNSFTPLQFRGTSRRSFTIQKFGLQPSCNQRHLHTEAGGDGLEKIELSILFAVSEGITQAGAMTKFGVSDATT